MLCYVNVIPHILCDLKQRFAAAWIYKTILDAGYLILRLPSSTETTGALELRRFAAGVSYLCILLSIFCLLYNMYIEL